MDGKDQEDGVERQRRGANEVLGERERGAGSESGERGVGRNYGRAGRAEEE